MSLYLTAKHQKIAIFLNHSAITINSILKVPGGKYKQVKKRLKRFSVVIKVKTFNKINIFIFLRFTFMDVCNTQKGGRSIK